MYIDIFCLWYTVLCSSNHLFLENQHLDDRLKTSLKETRLLREGNNIINC